MPTAFAAQSSSGNVAGETASELAKLIELIIAKIPLWIAALVVIIFTFILARIARSMVENKMAEKGIEEAHKEVQILGGRMTYAGIVIIGITIGLKIAGIDLTTIIAAGAFGIGFAMKDLIMNFLAGVMILVGRHFTIGDFINVGGTIGKVVEIQSRVTVLQAIDGTKVIVPNSELLKKQVISFTSNPFRRIEIIHGVDYRSNLENVLKICMQVLHHTEGVLMEPKPSVVFYEFGDYSINFKLRAWVDSRGGWLKVKNDLIVNLNKALEEYNIDVPWPIYTINYDKDMNHQEKMLEKRIVTPSPTQTPEPIVSVTAQTQVTDNYEEQPLKPLGEQRL